MKRVAIYARYSSDLQSATSIEDQVRLCEAFARQRGWQVTGHYTDHAMSGASAIRPGLDRLQEDARRRAFDIVLAEALDRISRDQADTPAIHKRLKFYDIQIVTLVEGDVSELHVGFKGTMNALYLSDLSLRTWRGIEAKILARKFGGGRAYGYDVVYERDGNGERIPGIRAINLEQARTIERIFREYLAGRSPRAIAKQLNDEGVPGPRGKGWGASTIYGNRQRGTGILNNELYIGWLVWNKLKYIKHPDTRKRNSRINPESEWRRVEIPELRILDQELWDAVKEKQGQINTRKSEFWQRQRPRNLLSYLIECQPCGGGYSMISKTHYGCSTARNKGTCDNRLTISKTKLEAAVLGALQDDLMDEELCAEFCEEYTKHINRMRMEQNASINSLRRESERIEQQLHRLVDSIADGDLSPTIMGRINSLEKRKAEIAVDLETSEEAPVYLHPNMARRYHEEVQRLVKTLDDEEHRTEAAELLRGLIKKIEIKPDKEHKTLTVELKGDLAGILQIATGPRGRKKKRSSNTDDLLLEQDKLVAGAGFEPATFRL